jgi:glycosyltransferase involved in cell wall biosynthesis
VIRGGIDGYLTPPTVDALADATVDLLYDPMKRAEMGKAAAQGASRFGERAATEKLLTIYDQTLAEPYSRR